MRTFTPTTTATDWRPGADCAGGLTTTTRSDPINPWTTRRRKSGIDLRRVTGAGQRRGRSCDRRLRRSTEKGLKIIQRTTRSRTVSSERAQFGLEVRPPSAVRKRTSKNGEGGQRATGLVALSFQISLGATNEHKTGTGAASENTSLKIAPGGSKICMLRRAWVPSVLSVSWRT